MQTRLFLIDYAHRVDDLQFRLNTNSNYIINYFSITKDFF